MALYKIYTLTDPRTNMVFYVGASQEKDHVTISRHKGWKKGIRKELRELGIAPLFEIIDTAHKISEAAQLEEYWYYQLRSWGFHMDNSLNRGFRKYQGEFIIRFSPLALSCAKQLKELSRNITGADKNEALSVCRLSRPTLDKYLKGTVTDIDKALELVQFFKGKTQARIGQLKGAA